MYVAGSYFHIQNNAVDVAGSIGLIGQLLLRSPLTNIPQSGSVMFRMTV